MSCMLSMSRISLRMLLAQMILGPPCIHSLSMNTIGICGSLGAPISGGCCYDSLDLVASNGHQSGTHEIIPDDQLNSISLIVPAGANGASYCHLTSANTSALLGYSQVYV